MPSPLTSENLPSKTTAEATRTPSMGASSTAPTSTPTTSTLTGEPTSPPIFRATQWLCRKLVLMGTYSRQVLALGRLLLFLGSRRRARLSLSPTPSWGSWVLWLLGCSRWRSSGGRGDPEWLPSRLGTDLPSYRDIICVIERECN